MLTALRHRHRWMNPRSIRAFSQEATEYIVVGSGSAGCVVASRLAEAGKSVLLVEAGEEDTMYGVRSLFTRLPTALSIPMHFNAFNWGFLAEKEEKLQGRQITCPRGKGLGGSSSINGMVYVRGHPMDYESWKESGAEGWGWSDVAPYFKRMENFDGPDEDALRGRKGPLHVKHGDNALNTKLFQAFRDAGEEAGYGQMDDYNGIRQEGFSNMPMTVFHSGPRKGERCSTSAAYLEPALKKYPSNLRVVTNAQISRIKWDRNDPTRAIGVQCTDGDVFKASEEVILACGSIGSPHLLQVSGVGDRKELESCGIRVRVDRKGVGKNLMDHLEYYFQFECSGDSLAPYLSWWNKLMIGVRWILFRDGLGATNHFEAGGFIRSKAGVKYPDIQFHFLPVAVSYDGVTMPPTNTGHSFQMHIGANRSVSRGSVQATSGDITEAPKITFNYMTDDSDWKDMRESIRLAREIVKQPALSAFAPREIYPGEDKSSDDELDAFLAEHLESAYHPCGTCKMGSEDDEMAVVDSQGRVFGTSGLRVVDSSVFPTIPNGNLNAPTIMTAEKMSDHILESPTPVTPPTATAYPEGWIDPNWQTQQREKPPVVSA